MCVVWWWGRVGGGLCVVAVGVPGLWNWWFGVGVWVLIVWCGGGWGFVVGGVEQHPGLVVFITFQWGGVR